MSYVAWQMIQMKASMPRIYSGWKHALESRKSTTIPQQNTQKLDNHCAQVQKEVPPPGFEPGSSEIDVKPLKI